LCSKISAKIETNGHLSDSSDGKRGYKQGDALSCAFFIQGISPLLRNINRDPVIRSVEIRTRITKSKVKFRLGPMPLMLM
jgi:hypothetical protein